MWIMTCKHARYLFDFNSKLSLVVINRSARCIKESYHVVVFQLAVSYPASENNTQITFNGLLDELEVLGISWTFLLSLWHPYLCSHSIGQSLDLSLTSFTTMASPTQFHDALDHDPVQEQSKMQPKPAAIKEIQITSSLEDFQTDEQRRVLDTVAQVRKCGLEGILSLPQLVVCGDQSAGKSSVLEALTEIPFPRNDNLCTRFATEIILRRGNTDSLKIKLIPDPKRPSNEQAKIKAFEESITDFDELPKIMNVAMTVMDVGANSTSGSQPRAFARDVLSIEIEGPSRPQLTLVDIPGLIQTDTKGVTKADVDLVGEITDQYITQPRTICLAVVSGANDYANQKILTKVREVDPEGDRTLGIITKPDKLDSGSGSDAAFISLAQNEDIHFKLGWHVLKNRKFEERDFSLVERNFAEDNYFRTSNFKCLPTDCVGIDALRVRLSKLLFEHVRQELPKLRSDLEEVLSATSSQLAIMGDRRATSADCRTYLTQLSMTYRDSCKAAVDGHYEGEYFISDSNQDLTFSLDSPSTIRRMRAVIQLMNAAFEDFVRVNGHKFEINMSGNADAPNTKQIRRLKFPELHNQAMTLKHMKPLEMNKEQALAWVRSVLVRNRGKELIGNFNPLLIAELFWEQCSKWQDIAMDYLDKVHQICSNFLELLLKDQCPKDVISRLQASIVQDALKAKYDNALQELKHIIEDTKSCPINYNHYYTDTINKRRQERNKISLAGYIKDATTCEDSDQDNKDQTSPRIDINKAIEAFSQDIDPNMDNVSCEEALDCLYAIYKVSHLKHIYL